MGAIANAYVQIGANTSQLTAQVQAMGKQIDDEMAKRRANTSRALLNVSRGVQDFAAAGLLGIVNNVEGIAQNVAQAMGTSAAKATAFAGGLTLVAVGLQIASPLIKQLAEDTSKFFGFWQSGAEQLQNSVTYMMGGSNGLRAMSQELQKQAEFLQSRTDAVGGFKIDFISRAMGFKGVDEKALENNQRRAVEAAAIMAQAFEKAAAASYLLEASQRGAAARFDFTTGQQSDIRLNRQLFQESIDKFGGGVNLRTKVISEARQQLGMNRSDAIDLYGLFSMGDRGATKQIEQLLDLSAERTKIMAEDFEAATGSAAELARIEEQSMKRSKEFADAQLIRQQRETEQASKDLLRLEDQQTTLTERLTKFQQDRAERLRESFQFADLGSARDRLFMAAQDAQKDELTASKMQNEIDRVVKALDTLKLKWGMV